MSYNTIAAMAQDGDLRLRYIASAAQEGEDAPGPWVDYRIWTLISSSDQEQAYASAVAAGNERPGYDESVITDGMILARVQSVMASTE